MLKREKILYDGKTDTDHYQVVDMTYEGRRARVLFNGEREAAFSGIPLDGGSDLLFDYIQRLYELAATIRPVRLLIIGGGVYTLPTALLHSLPDIHIDAVEIDPGLDTIAEGFFGLRHNSRQRIFHEDGKEYLRNTNEVYDMIIIDAFTNTHIPQSLAQTNTALMAHKRLGPSGILAMNIISPYLGRQAQVIRHFYDMYSKTFDYTTVYPADSSTSLWQSQNMILVAQKGRLCSDYGLRFGKLDPPSYNPL